jgi:hypothetical protein
MDYTYLEESLFALVLWREAQNQSEQTMTAVAWSIRNRVMTKNWFGVGYVGVITHPWQYSSFNANDPNSRKYPTAGDVSFKKCMRVATAVYQNEQPDGPVDPTQGAVSYYDKSLDSNPPKWALDTVQMKHTVDVGDFHFYKLV